jgi:hypothetical protein
MKMIAKNRIVKHFKDIAPLRSHRERLSFLQDNLKFDLLIRPYYRPKDEFTVEVYLDFYYPAGHTALISLSGTVDEKHPVLLSTPLKRTALPRTQKRLYIQWREIVLITAKPHSFPIGRHSFELLANLNVFDSNSKREFLKESIESKGEFEIIEQFPKDYIVPVEDQSLLKQCDLTTKFYKYKGSLMFHVGTSSPIKVGLAYRVEILDEKNRDLFRGWFGVPPGDTQSFSGPIVTQNHPEVLFLRLVPDPDVALLKNTRTTHYLNVRVERKKKLPEIEDFRRL